MATMIDEKYKGMYKGASDWIGRLIDERCVKVTTEGDRETREVHLPDLFRLAEANGMDKDKLAALKAQQSSANAPGRIRMTIGNMLRAAARRRHGLYDIDGVTPLKPDAEFRNDERYPEKAVETLDGEKIGGKPKAEAKKAPAKKAEAKKAPAKKAPAKKAAKKKAA